MDDSMAHSEDWRIFLRDEPVPGTRETSNDQPGIGQRLQSSGKYVYLVNNPQPDVEARESAASDGERKRKGRPARLTEAERKEKKIASDRNRRQDNKDKINRFMKIASELGGIDKMESCFKELKQMMLRYGGLEEIQSKLKQMEEESEIFNKVKTMFGGIEYIEPGLDNLKKADFGQNECRRQYIHFMPSFPDSPKNLSDNAERSANSNNRGSTDDGDMVRDDGICDMSLAVETPGDLVTKTRSNVDSSSFKDSDGERQRVGNYNFPMSPVSTVKAIRKAHGDVTRNCSVDPSAVKNANVLLRAAINEMSNLQIERFTEKKLKDWKGAIVKARQTKINVEYAWEQWKKNAYAYSGFKAQDYRTCSNRMKELKDEVESSNRLLEKMSKP